MFKLDAAEVKPVESTEATKPAFETLLAEYAPMLGRIAASYEAQPAAREDLLQEIALALWQALPKWRGEASRRSFIARIAHNRCVSHVVTQSKHRHEAMNNEALMDETTSPEYGATRSERYERLQRALRRLPLGQRQAVTLALEGFTHGEIAETLDIKVNNADARISRARRTLVKQLGEQ
jgi:RNA polymerase sigma-70 factor (ECF subfamily)